MKKLRIVGIVLIMALCILGMVGCNKKEENLDTGLNNDIRDKVNTSSKDDEKDLENIIGGSKIEENTSGNNESGDSGDVSGKIGLSTTEDRAVFNFGNAYYIIFDFSGDQVVNYSYCYMYDNEEAGKQAYEQYMNELKDVNNSELTGLENIKEIKRDGKYVTITMKESVSQDMTREEVMETYKYLEKISQK